ncbi:hypothetical protein G7B40_006940 [Aetokthonos hydrillicola Thurmond2011]|jgi:hypothetical protein|uniref:Type I restriction enzyme R protein N-terminal domain-containing protein n=1 Tax=Aetokthonos hydrillicola Thurmond2011 TaxID=2712845 RepID=A0AAP5I396_9CYAN|nr:hypothetical protein [Aetokthonos hydrillicola]MBO3459234.1 hypothetical protein [Aetokthonos hydrillicola CCALA 1050]MBW4584933.1 hypothetical protein [Aetokthonos hydrillicola CCALA 1050]MDR9894308.1 hypothetical protein [Aetokthonos hydrillicola Thurmond2011]
MPYSQFTTITKAKDAFGLQTVEGVHFFPKIAPISPSETLLNYLAESLPIAASGSEKMRSEGIIYPILLEVRRILDKKVNLFSGEDFTVDESLGLNGVCDFLISSSLEVLEIEAPVIIIVEAKKADLRTGIGQCVAEMVAAQRFNELRGNSKNTIYGSVTNGILWRFLKLEGQVVTLDLTDYPLPPVDEILGFFVWMAENA